MSMRRMKIRAKPNFGGGAAGGGAGGTSRGNSGPGRGSGTPVEAQCYKTEVASSPAADMDEPSGASVVLPSGTEATSSVALSGGLQRGSKKPHSNTSHSASQINAAQASQSSVQRVEALGGVTDCTSGSVKVISGSEESTAALETLEPDASLVPTPQTEPSLVPRDVSVTAEPTIQTPVDRSVDVPLPSAAEPVSDTSSTVSKNVTQEPDAKSALCMRRKKFKVKPMLGGVRKGGVMDKAKTKADSDSNTLDLSDKCAEESPSVNQMSSEENVSSSENMRSDHLKLEMQERAGKEADPACVSENPDGQPVGKADPEKERNITPKSPECSEIHPMGKEVLQVKEEIRLKKEILASRYEVEVVKDTAKSSAAVSPMPSPADDSPTSQSTSNSSAPTAGYKRRAKIRAKPSLLVKKKKEDDKDLRVKPVEQIPTTDESLEAVSSQEVIARCDSVEPDAAAVRPSDDSGECHVTEERKVKPNVGVPQKEVKHAESEGNKKHSHVLNITDKDKESEELAQTQKSKREGIHASFKENADSPLHSNIKTPRKKKLSENKEIDPELEVVDVVDVDVEKQGKKRLHQDKREVVSSDDSTGDKENASTAVTGLAKQERTTKENSSVTTQKAKTKPPIHCSKLFWKPGRKVKVEEDPNSPDEEKKQMFKARKSEFRKKMSKGALEHSKMTMFDLIYWNPASNPMPGSTTSPKRPSSKGDTDSIMSETAEEQRIDDLGLDPADPEQQSCPESPEAANGDEEATGKPREENKDSAEVEKDAGEDSANNEGEEACEKDIFAPRVKIGPNGEIIVDEQSIKIQTTAAKNRDEVLSKAVVVEESGDSSHYGRWSKRRRRSCEWTVKETALFYKALSTVGTDFSLMETLIKWRTRAELKTKFKKEERNHRDLVDLALNDSTQFDMTVFEEEPDYDPKEDRKVARQAERAEAKRRRMEMKQQDKIKEMEKKKLEKKKLREEIKERKKALRQAYRNRGRKRKAKPYESENENEDSPSLCDSDSGSEGFASDQTQPEDVLPVEPRVMVKRRQAERRNSLVISEVTVTMETVKYDKPASEASPPSPREEDTPGDSQVPHDDTHPSSSSEHVLPHRREELIHRDEEGNEMSVLDKYSQLPLNEGLPESSVIENMVFEDEGNSEKADSNSHNEGKSTEVSTSEAAGTSESAEATAELQPCDAAAQPSHDNKGQRTWHFPVSAIQTLEDGRQVIVVPTSNGHYSVPVPVLPPGTSNVVVMATDVPHSPGELIYHVYVVSPLEGGGS